MDLVVLVAPGGATMSVKGKERAVDVDTRGWTSARLSVWRMLGSKVWDVEIKGRVLGLAWSIDGEHQSSCCLAPSTPRGHGADCLMANS